MCTGGSRPSRERVRPVSGHNREVPPAVPTYPADRKPTRPPASRYLHGHDPAPSAGRRKRRPDAARARDRPAHRPPSSPEGPLVETPRACGPPEARPRCGPYHPARPALSPDAPSSPCGDAVPRPEGLPAPHAVERRPRTLRGSAAHPDAEPSPPRPRPGRPTGWLSVVPARSAAGNLAHHVPGQSARPACGGRRRPRNPTVCFPPLMTFSARRPVRLPRTREIP
ncbi:hypothetical protein BMG523Draft_00422 [Frankia sp. BMG5.23]|nr:hypothetical protein BMG523Draft_00422 [Frankia sp. BMG5.23]